MFCTTIVLYGVFTGVILGITDGQAERLDQHCRNLMTGRRFGWYVPFNTYLYNDVEFTMYSNTNGTLVQITGDSGTENYTIPEEGVTSFNRFSTDSLLIISDADIGVSARSLNLADNFDMRLLCVPEGPSQHFMSSYSSYMAIISLDAENEVRYNTGGTTVSTIRLQERNVWYQGRYRYYNVVCSGSCAVYEYVSGVPNNRNFPVMPVQFYPSDYFIMLSQSVDLYGSTVQGGATVFLTIGSAQNQIGVDSRYSWMRYRGPFQAGYLRCSTSCETRIRYFPQHNRFFSPPESTNGSLIQSTGNKWMIVFDYGLTENRTFEEVYSLESISPSGSNQMNISRTEFVNNTSDVFKYVFVDAPSGVYRISNISDIGSSAIYVQDVTDENHFIIPLYYASYPSKTVDLCQRNIELCSSPEVCINEPENFNYSCVQEINECATNPCKNNGTCTDTMYLFNCSCAGGFTGSTCEEDINECDSNPCLNGGTCTHAVDLFNCSCVEGFTGYSCEEDINECGSNPCLNGANCTDGVDRFNCSCVEGFTGYSCEEDIDDCETNRCLNSGTCVDGVNSFTCQCVEGFENGDLGTCEIVLGECTESPCLNGGTCESVGDSFRCNCTQGFGNGVLGICEVVEDAVPGYSWWRGGRFRECAHLQTSTYNVTNIQECGIKCSESEEFCSAFVFGPDERCTLTKAICESQNTSGNLYFRKDIEFVRLSTFGFEVFMDERDAENSKHHFIGLKIENIGDYTQERDAELRSLVESKQDTLVELLYQSQFVIDVNLDRLESGSVVAVYDVLLNNVDGATLLDHVSNTLAEFRNLSGLQIDENSLLDYASDGCSKLPDFCLNGGTCRNAPEGAVYCQCPAAFSGDKCQNPVVNVTSIFPIRGSGPFGPESGGTRITMMGSHLNLTGPPVVDLGGFVCPLNSSSPVSIVCQTARAIRPEAIGTELSITLSWPPQDHPLPQGKLETVYSFLYLKDPNISTVFPLKTIAAGGVDLSITGESMDSVAVPVMEMVALTGDTVVNVFYEDCDLRNSSLFVCPTANLNLTEANRRRKREAEPIKRYTFNGKEVEIEINFFLDGVQEFRNMSEARPEYSTIVVFIDPQMEPPTEVETFRPFWPFGDEFLTRTGFNLLDGLKESQYKAFVGTDQCTEVSVETNSISCRAPPSEPEKSNEFYDHPELVIVVGRGRLSFQCGSINYEEHLLEYRPVQIATGGAVFLVILVVGVTILCCRYKRNILNNRPSGTADGVETTDVLNSRQQATKTTQTEPPTGEDAVNEQPGYVDPAANQSSAGGYQNWYPAPYEDALSQSTQPYITDTSQYAWGSTFPTMFNMPHAYDNNIPGNYLAPSRGYSPYAYNNIVPGNYRNVQRSTPGRPAAPPLYHRRSSEFAWMPSVPNTRTPHAYDNNLGGNYRNVKAPGYYQTMATPYSQPTQW